MNKGFLVAILTVLALTGSVSAQEPDGSMRTWVNGEYLLYFLRPAQSSQPLLTTGPLTRPGGGSAGALGNPDTQILAGNQNFNTGIYNGFRINAGWIKCDDSFGVEGSFFYLSPHSTSQTFNSDSSGNPLLARPVIDARTGNETALLVSAPNAFSGSVNIGSQTSLFGGDGNILWPVCRGCCDDDVVRYFYFLSGFRYLNLRDDLTINQNTMVLPTGVSFFNGLPVLSPGQVGVSDDIRTLNQFYGGQIGVQTGLTWWRFTLNGTAKVALGSMREEASINGTTSVNYLGQNLTTPGGLLSASSNGGSHTRNILAVVPEGKLSVIVEITPQIKLMLGYSILYASNVARPGEQIDRSVNRTAVPTSEAFNPSLGGPQHPAFNWNGTDFWAQGVNIGIGLRF
ncbi:MAG TPA: BBP7 family outer membrane beta-barrel protein [Gemmataceae bacterium]|nr:BBP7 family outer membrane beta-barrel protein [Gemmataceae bacterium]